MASWLTVGSPSCGVSKERRPARSAGRGAWCAQALQQLAGALRSAGTRDRGDAGLQQRLRELASLAGGLPALVGDGEAQLPVY